MSVLSKEERFYASKPPACSSPLVTVKDGKTVRVHDGHYLGPYEAVNRSTYTTDPEEIRLSHTFEKQTLGELI